MADIEALNARAVSHFDPLPVTKLSLPAYARVAGDYVVLASGAALGFGCGPLLVAPADSTWEAADVAAMHVAIPGRNTTAFLLLMSLLGRPRQAWAMRFDEIMPAVAAAACDAGLVIHESRFTFRNHGLRELCDFGELWQRATAAPLPLGIIAARRDLGAEVLARLTAMLRDSVRLARNDPDRPRHWVREHAQEMSDEVCDQHIELYVNDFTEDLGDVGRNAIDQLLRRGRDAGMLPAVSDPFAEGAA